MRDTEFFANSIDDFRFSPPLPQAGENQGSRYIETSYPPVLDIEDNGAMLAARAANTF